MLQLAASPFEAMEVETPHHVSLLKSLHRGPRPIISSMTSIPEDEVHADPTASVDENPMIEDVAPGLLENKAKATDDIAATIVVGPVEPQLTTITQGEANAPSLDGPPVPTTPSTNDNSENIVMARNRDGDMVPTKWPKLVTPPRMGPEYEFIIHRRPRVFNPMPMLPNL
ncbi:hypothetical protein ZWY2020_002910 [Hordeum vulgare]|nr:hypothetical protein ZWY2020_002910 [Hordeum vulgare]